MGLTLTGFQSYQVSLKDQSWDQCFSYAVLMTCQVLPKTALALFADDSKCFRTIQDTNDCLLLQRDIDSLYNWGKRWDLSLFLILVGRS